MSPFLACFIWHRTSSKPRKLETKITWLRIEEVPTPPSRPLPAPARQGCYTLSVQAHLRRAQYYTSQSLIADSGSLTAHQLTKKRTGEKSTSIKAEIELQIEARIIGGRDREPKSTPLATAFAARRKTTHLRLTSATDQSIRWLAGLSSPGLYREHAQEQITPSSHILIIDRSHGYASLEIPVFWVTRFASFDSGSQHTTNKLPPDKTSACCPHGHPVFSQPD